MTLSAPAACPASAMPSPGKAVRWSCANPTSHHPRHHQCPGTESEPMRRLPKRSTRRVTSRVWDDILTGQVLTPVQSPGTVSRSATAAGPRHAFRRSVSSEVALAREAAPAPRRRYRDVNCPVPAHRESSIKIVAIALATLPHLIRRWGRRISICWSGDTFWTEVSTSPLDAGSGRATCSAICCVLRAGLLDAPSTSALNDAIADLLNDRWCNPKLIHPPTDCRRRPRSYQALAAGPRLDVLSLDHGSKSYSPWWSSEPVTACRRGVGAAQHAKPPVCRLRFSHMYPSVRDRRRHDQVSTP